jgi:hypothetical protein
VQVHRRVAAGVGRRLVDANGHGNQKSEVRNQKSVQRLRLRLRIVQIRTVRSCPPGEP